MSGSQLLRRYFFAPVGVSIALAALLNAKAVSELVGIAVAPDSKEIAAPRAVGGSSRALARADARVVSAAPILERNPFDHVTGPLRPPPTVDAPDGGAGGAPAPNDDPWAAPICSGIDVQVIVASKDDAWSFASFSTSDGKRHLMRKGGEVGGRKVLFVGWDRAWLTGDGGMCQAVLLDQKSTPSPSPSTPPPPVASASASPPARGAKPLDPDLKKGIKQMSPTEFAIDRGVVDRILENQSELMRQARIVPEQENGRTVGVRLVGIKPDSLLGVLGMQNGDRLQTINGFEMANPERALEAYARLRTADKLTVQINRGGKNMNLDYNIR